MPKGLKNENFTVILVNPESSGNIGSICRVMKNFGFKNLIVIDPEEDPLSDYSQGFAMKAKDVLRNAEIVKNPSKSLTTSINTLKNIFSRFDIVIGTSAKGYSYKNLKRIPVFVNEIDLTRLTNNSKIAIVFGRESTGLTNEEVMLTDFLIRIPANPQYPTLNIAQATGIVLYELYSKMSEPYRGQVIPANFKDKDQLLDLFQDIMNWVPLPDSKRLDALTSLKNITGRSFMSKKENTSLYSFFKKILVCFRDPKIILELNENKREKKNQ